MFRKRAAEESMQLIEAAALGDSLSHTAQLALYQDPLRSSRNTGAGSDETICTSVTPHKQKFTRKI